MQAILLAPKLIGPRVLLSLLVYFFQFAFYILVPLLKLIQTLRIRLFPYRYFVTILWLRVHFATAAVVRRAIKVVVCVGLVYFLGGTGFITALGNRLFCQLNSLDINQRCLQGLMRLIQIPALVILIFTIFRSQKLAVGWIFNHGHGVIRLDFPDCSGITRQNALFISPLIRSRIVVDVFNLVQFEVKGTI